MRVILVGLLVALILITETVCAPPRTIFSDTVVVVTTEDNADNAYKLALRDVSQDWYARLGRPPIVVNSFPSPESNPFNVGSNFIVIFGSNDALKKEFPEVYSELNLGPQAPEQHYCKVLAFNTTASVYPLVCGGSDRRGSIYALYEFSHSVLGVDPQRFWIEKNTRTVGQIEVDISYSFDSGAPFFKYRGFFINDEDQLGGWAMDPIGQKVFTLQMWDMVYQTTLRLKGNAVIVGTAAYPDEQSFVLASRRGLAIAEHHITLLGNNIFGWPDGLPYDYPYNPEVVEHVWKSVVSYQVNQNRDMLWTIGYRGKNDYPFWYDVPSFNTSALRGKLIGDAMQTQKDIVDSYSSEDNHLFTYLWDEMLPLYAGGYLKIPDGVSIVHADNGAGQIFDQNTVAEGHGLYYHVAMMSGSQNQLTELCSPSRIYEQLLTFVKKKANSYFILNTSDIRAVPLSTQAAMEFVWNPTPFLSTDPVTAQTKFIKGWVSRVYDLQNASVIAQIAQLYSQYYDVDYMSGRDNATPLGEQYLSSQIRHLVDSTFTWGMSGRKGTLPVKLATDMLKFTENPTKQLQAISTQAQALVNELPLDRQQFYRSHLVFQTNLHLYAVRALTNVASAVLILTNGTANSTDNALRQFNDAIAQIDLLIQAEHAAEAGVFEYWFMWDQLDDWFSVRDHIRNASMAVMHLSMNQIPPGRWWHGGTGPWSQEFQYEYDQKTYFPLFYNSSYYFDTAVLVLCSSSDCSLTPIGVSITGESATVVVQTERKDLVVRYTLDGSVPTSSSPEAKGAITLTAEWVKKYENAAVSAVAFTSNGIAAGPVTRAIVRSK